MPNARPQDDHAAGSALRRAGPAPAAPDGPTPEAGDARLVDLARAGDDEAFGALVRRYERKLLRILLRLVHDEGLARDLAQETFWKVYTRLDRFDTSRRFGPWLFRIGVNLGLDELRRRGAAGPPGGLLLSLDHALGLDRQGLDVPDRDPRARVELAQEVQFLVARLPMPYRTVLVLRDLEGLPTSEIAAIVQKREATVRWRLARAREMFRELWDRRINGALATGRSRDQGESEAEADHESEADDAG
jgi:RNA polymerase sigma-70 factor (ECF subfamily)